VAAIRRREFISLFGGAAITSPLQQSIYPRRDQGDFVAPDTTSLLCRPGRIPRRCTLVGQKGSTQTSASGIGRFLRASGKR